MDKLFKVAYFGIKPADEHETWADVVGVRTYTIGVEKITEIIKEANNGGRVDDSKLGLTPEDTVGQVFGGRSFINIDTKNINEVLENVDAVIVSTSTDVRMIYCFHFLGQITQQTLPKTCKIIFQLPFDADSVTHGRHDIDSWFRLMGLKRKAKSKKNSKEIFLIGSPALGGVHQDESIPLLRTSLLKDKAIKDVAKPIKETAGIFHSITNWLNKIVH